MQLGYARVSTDDQTLDLQLNALKLAGCRKIFRDTASGAKTSRPDLDQAFEQLREGDTLVVWKLDRLGRTLRQLIELITQLSDSGIGFKSLTEQIDTTSPNGKLFFHIFASLAEFERDLIRERTRAGLLAARARGRQGGRPPKLMPEQVRAIRALYDAKQQSVHAICRSFGIGKTTLYASLKRGS
jgi:DNA invertase Pin-like site-specific DNA recombinase